MTLMARIRAAWSVFSGRAIALEQHFKTDAEAELLQLHARIISGLRYAKDIPMAIADDITALGNAITAYGAAKDAAAAQTVQELATANATNASLQAELTAADQQVLALTASITPAPVAVDPNAPPA
ncbi:hypothetical protein [Novosphingobium sp.]|uniref:hypothetical protein n=1 Tax=Novosphingobium sp. TaxID=1874826 RepID=UPI003D11BF2D